MEGIPAHDPRLVAEAIIESSPSIALRVTGEPGSWKTEFITKNVATLGYSRGEFLRGERAWQDLVHPEDLPGLTQAIADNFARGVDHYRTLYRVVKADGEPMWVSDHSTVIRNPDGTAAYSDCIITDYTETRRHIDMIEDHYRQQRVLKEILLGLHDADPRRAVQIILDSTGVYLDVSRVILFEDDPGGRRCRPVYEWCNTGVASLGGFVLDYHLDIPEIAADLRSQGYRLVNYGDIPERSREEFETEGVVAAAIFAVYVDTAFYGFICFDECVKPRVWNEDQTRFLHNISNLVGPAITRSRGIPPYTTRTDTDILR